MTILIQLIGEQALPNLLVPAYLKPNRTLLVYTERTKQVKDRISTLIENGDYIECDPYNIPEIIHKLKEKIDSYDQDQLIFNLTGGTKAMVLAANHLAASRSAKVVYLESERGKSRLYKYHYDKQRDLHLDGREELHKPLITIETFLHAYIGKGGWEESGPSKDIGGTFERVVAEVLQRRITDLEIKQGVRFLGDQRPQVDLDIVLRYRNQFARIECKSGGKTKTLDALKQLQMVATLLGTYTQQIIALTDDPNEEHGIVYEATKTKVIVLKSFSQNNRLNQQDEDNLVNEICKILSIDNCTNT